MHGMYFERVFMTERGHTVDKIGERDAQLVDVGKHDHCEQISEDALRYVDYIYAVCGTFRADLGDDAARVATGYGDNSLHK